MYVRGIKLVNFRNYKEKQIQFDTDTTVIFGKNAQGKTNILEALYVCACLRSHRTYKDTELIMHGENEYRIYLDYYEPDEFGSEPTFTESLCVFYSDVVIGNPTKTKPKRIMKHNGMKFNKASEIIGLFKAVIFAPEDLNIIKEGPSIRRRYIDILISQIRPSYFNELNIFQKVLMQRNTLLKQMRDGKTKSDYETIHVWDVSLANSAAKIILTRKDFAKKINDHASVHHNKMSSGKEEITVKYKSVAGIDFNEALETVQTKIINKLKGNFYEDIERGTTSYGPHRDDLEIFINGEPIRIFASQGQQRTAVLALKIAELEIIYEETGTMPVLLLDDVMSELDDNRREQLMSSIGVAQVILTCTEPEHAAPEFIKLNPNRTVKYLEVKDGDVLISSMV